MGAEENDGKEFYNLTNNDIYEKTIEHLRNRADVNLVNNKKLSKMYIKNKPYLTKSI